MQDQTAPPELSVTAEPAAASRPELERLAQLADALVEQVGAARRRLDDLRAALDEASAPPDAAPAPLLQETAPDDPEMLLERVRLDALNMALTGSSSDETRQHLLQSFEGVAVDDIDDVVDVTFGAPFDEGGIAAAPKRRFGRFRRN